MTNSKQSHILKKQARGMPRQAAMHHYLTAAERNQIRYGKRRRRNRVQHPTHHEYSEQPFRFLDLPLDIRLLIYEYLVPQWITPGIEFGMMTIHRQPCFALLRANKQIRHEATKLFYMRPHHTFVVRGTNLYVYPKKCVTRSTMKDYLSHPAIRYLQHLSILIDTSYCVAESGVTAIREMLSELFPALEQLRYLYVDLTLSHNAESILGYGATTVAGEILSVLNVANLLRKFNIDVLLLVDHDQVPGLSKGVLLRKYRAQKPQDNEVRKLQQLVRKVERALRIGTVALKEHPNNRDRWWAAEASGTYEPTKEHEHKAATDRQYLAEEVEPVEVERDFQPRRAYDQHVGEMQPGYEADHGNGLKEDHERQEAHEHRGYQQEASEQVDNEQADYNQTHHQRPTSGQTNNTQGFQRRIALSERDGIKLRYAYENPKLCLLQHAALFEPRPGRRPKSQGEVLYRQHIKFDE